MSRTRVLALAACLAAAAVMQAPARAASAFAFDVVRTVRLPPGGAEIVAVSPNGKLAAVTQIGGDVQTFRLPKGKLKKKVDVRDIGEPTSVAEVRFRTTSTYRPRVAGESPQKLPRRERRRALPDAVSVERRSSTSSS